MAVITFRNVQGRSDAVGAQLLRDAGTSIKSGLGELGGIVDDATALRKGNEKIVGDNATAAFKDKIASFGTTEELQAAQDSGEIDAFKSSLSPGADKDVLRTGVTDQLNSLRTKTLADQSFEKNQLEREVAPALDQLNAAIASGDTEQTAQLMRDNKDRIAAIGKLGDTTQAIEDEKRATTARDRDEAVFKTQQAAIKSATAKDALVQDTLGLFSTLASGENNIIINGQKAGLSPTDVGKAVEEYNTQFTLANGLNPGDLESLQRVEQKAEITATREKAEATQELQSTEAQFPIKPQFNFADAEALQIGDAVAAGEAAGFDKDSAWFGVSSVSEVVLSVKDDVLETMKADRLAAIQKNTGTAATKEQKEAILTDVTNIMPHIMTMAVKSMGSNDAYGEADDLPAAKLQRVVEGLLKDYETNQLNSAKVATARRAYNNSVEASDLNVINKSKSETERLKNNAISVRNLQRQL